MVINRSIAAIASSFCLFLSTPSSAETLEDCLLENLKGVTSDIAAKTITDACEKKFGGANASNSNGQDKVENNLTSEIVLTLNKPLFSSDVPEYRIPVPAGNWQKVGEATRHRVQPPMYSEVWVNVVDGVVHHLMYVDYNKSGNSNGWKPSKLCDRVNLHFIEKVENRDGGNQNCLAVNHFRLSGGSDKNPAVKQAKDWARDNRLGFPSTAVVHHHRLAYLKYLDFWIGYNPEVEGFPPPSDATWNSNDWHQDRVIGDAKREAYIQKVLAAGKETHEAIVSQFDFN